MVANRELRRRCHAPHTGVLNAQRKDAGDTRLGSAAPFWVPRPKPLGVFVSGREVTLSSAAPAAPCPHWIPRRGSFKSLAGRPPLGRSAAMGALRAGLTLALGAGLGAVVEGWRRRREDARAAPGLLGRLPVLPVAAAAELPPVPGGPRGPGELAKYGLPGLAQLKSRESYVLCYDPRTRGALWVVEQLRPERLRGDGDRRECDFREDDSVHAYHRATNADYRGSGFDRGHLAAAANHRWSQKAMDDTFYLSNVAPQVPHLNQNAWNNLEKYSRSLTRSYQNVYVCTGPLFLPRSAVHQALPPSVSALLGALPSTLLGSLNLDLPDPGPPLLLLCSPASQVEATEHLWVCSVVFLACRGLGLRGNRSRLSSSLWNPQARDGVQASSPSSLVLWANDLCPPLQNL
ncbi:endonuclease G, mitochondrial isoform X1 [Pan troglodytes]|uniref:endonuclease G, mitochondrial isoform X1 n=1 Tax=Pan troglodytes TaxID=9598 RepID=UPI0007DBC6FF|nr:endonuclease G, mitochondrial isoform X1 [Pan troglodytes]